MIYELYETIPKVRDSEANYTKEKGTQLVPIFRECYTVSYTSCSSLSLPVPIFREFFGNPSGELHGVIIFST